MTADHDRSGHDGIDQSGTGHSGTGHSVVITVVRTGGFAGLRRQWTVTALAPDADQWLPLIDACPWRSVPADHRSRDRFVWEIDARTGRRRRRASVPDSGLTGPWRLLVERVQAVEEP